MKNNIRGFLSAMQLSVAVFASVHFTVTVAESAEEANLGVCDSGAM